MSLSTPRSEAGATFEPERDGLRLDAQRMRVWWLVRDGRWRTLAGIARETGDPESSVSARLRDYRKARYGEHTVERRYVARGLWEYRVIVNRRDLWDAGNPGDLPRAMRESAAGA